jgi:hypothetical protein
MAKQSQPKKERLLKMLKSTDGLERRKGAEGLEKYGVADDEIISELRNLKDYDPISAVADAARHAFDVLRGDAYGSVAGNTTASVMAGTSPSEQSLLTELVSLQRQQITMLADIQKQTGCLYAYMIASFVLTVLGVVGYLVVR